MNSEYYVNVARVMRYILPRPRLRCTLHDDRAESIEELGIVKVRSELNILDLNSEVIL